MSAKTPLLVGLVLMLAVGGMTWFIMGTSKDTFDEDSTYVLYGDFVDASGIRPKTRLQINGIDVGKITGVEHVRGPKGRLMARVTLRVANQYEVFDNATLKKAAESLLGDFRLDLDPGTPDGKRLESGAVIPNVHSLSDIDEIKDQLLQVSHHVNDITQSFSKVLSGPEGEGSLKSILSKVESSMGAIESTTRALEHTIAGNDQVLSQIIKDIGHVSNALAEVSQPGGDLRTMSHNLASLSAKLGTIADTVQGLLDDKGTSGGGPAGAATDKQTASLRGTMDNLNGTVTSLNSIARKIDEGQGTLGRVVNDPGISDRVEATLDSANEIIGSIAGLETQIELRSEYGYPLQNKNNTQLQQAIKNTLALRILPKPDKYYILEAISDPRGRQTRRTTTTKIGNTTVSSDETVIAFNDLKFSAAFAKRYFFLTLRFGIIENTGGLGVNLHALEDHAELRIDAFDFDRRNPSDLQSIFPRLRVTGMLEVASHIHLQVGFDDPFNADLRTLFLGGVLRFTDDDLKAMLTIAPRP
jgi:phospholipid/cholesterol/gamma-HCH transport system substrate-binding protein